jgi:hypothetical protein
LFFAKERVNLPKIYTMKNIKLMDSEKFEFSTGAEIAILSLDDRDANQILKHLQDAANDLLASEGQLVPKGLNGTYFFNYKFCLIVFKVNNKKIDIMHIVNNKRFQSPKEAMPYNYERV